MYRSEKVGELCDTVVRIATWWRELEVDALSDKSGSHKSRESERLNINYPRLTYTSRFSCFQSFIFFLNS
jgi:hypothetical protein